MAEQILDVKVHNRDANDRKDGGRKSDSHCSEKCSGEGLVTLAGGGTTKLARYAQAATPAAFRHVAKASARKSR